MLSELNKQWLQKPKEKGERRQAKLREYFNSLPIFKKNYSFFSIFYFGLGYSLDPFTVSSTAT